MHRPPSPPPVYFLSLTRQIDYDTVMMLEPMTILGAVLGSFLNKILPDFILILLLAASLGLTAKHTMAKGLKSWAKETEALELQGSKGAATALHAQKRGSDKRGDYVSVLNDDDDSDDSDDVGSDLEEGAYQEDDFANGPSCSNKGVQKGGNCALAGAAGGAGTQAGCAEAGAGGGAVCFVLEVAMSCEGCLSGATKALVEAVPGVDKVTGDLKAQTLTVYLAEGTPGSEEGRGGEAVEAALRAWADPRGKKVGKCMVTALRPQASMLGGRIGGAKGKSEGGPEAEYTTLPLPAQGPPAPSQQETGGPVSKEVSKEGTIAIEMSSQEAKDAALAIIEEEERHHPLWKIALLTMFFGLTMVLDYLKDVEECGTPLFWVYTGLTVPWAILCTLAYRQYLTNRHKLKCRVGYEFVEGDVVWDDRATVLYPFLCTAAGLLAGLFGVGGGMIKGPLVLEMGLTPLQAHATGMVMILFTSGSACVSFYLFGQLDMDVGGLLFVMGLVCTAIGQFGFDKLMQRIKRQSLIILLMASVITISAILLTTRSALDAKHRIDHGESQTLYAFGNLCGKAHEKH